MQFPPDLLSSSIEIYEEFAKRTSASIVILGDTSYSNCCVDELVGKRWGVDAVIHFGNACLTESTGKVGVFYVFGDIPCPAIETSLDEISSGIIDCVPHDCSILFYYDFRYYTTARKLADCLKSKGVNLVFSEPALPGRNIPPDSSAFKHAGRIVSYSGVPKPPQCLLYLGECDSAFYSILISLKEAYTIKVLTVSPTTGQVAPASRSASSFLRRRYYLMEKVRSAKRIGILVSLYTRMST